MTAYIQEIKTLSRDLDELGIQWALIGALAVSIYGDPRTTKDIDVAVVVADKLELESIVAKLELRGYRNPQSLMHMSPMFQLGVRVMLPRRKPYEIPLDLLSNSSGIEREVVLAASKMEILPSTVLPVASLGHMIAMKILSQDDGERIRDRSDLASLLRNAQSTDLELARSALHLIEQRGFNRGRDLNEILDRFIGLVGDS